MAKTAKFDRQEVIKKATNLYWKKGFHATSMRNLQDEIDMRPGSIYSAFNSKEGLFKEVLRNYTNMGLTQIEALRNVLDTPIEVLKAFVKAQVIDTLTNAPNGVCMLAKTIGELTSENQELIDVTKDCLNEILLAFTTLIKEAQAQGIIDASKDAEELASYVQIQITGLRTFAKVNNNEAILHRKIDDIFNHYPFA
ncbi:TetR/AcrR family transcriptional regulator [Photobacterium carnosum]|uniref:TetR/AcrR family transcriptional regulator n=1 Tax=Photobacterium carnosum TaxID=2023717 RepID=UPI001E3A6C1F|nr:TetR/AcrR family transcriptional regulator [Photobacterium carnosum]MCD9555719.1 TetR/AcrR family transcriptional regulator [Photobacterium carnosum]